MVARSGKEKFGAQTCSAVAACGDCPIGVGDDACECRAGGAVTGGVAAIVRRKTGCEDRRSGTGGAGKLGAAEALAGGVQGRADARGAAGAGGCVELPRSSSGGDSRQGNAGHVRDERDFPAGDGQYANTTIKKLPNFSARRTTVHFDDVTAMERLHDGYIVATSNGYGKLCLPAMPPSSGGPLLREGDASSTVVTYRDGHEVADASTERRAQYRR